MRNFQVAVAAVFELDDGGKMDTISYFTDTLLVAQNLHCQGTNVYVCPSGSAIQQREFSATHGARLLTRLTDTYTLMEQYIGDLEKC